MTSDLSDSISISFYTIKYVNYHATRCAYPVDNLLGFNVVELNDQSNAITSGGGILHILRSN